jgi:hypothetical protein
VRKNTGISRSKVARHDLASDFGNTSGTPVSTSTKSTLAEAYPSDVSLSHEILPQIPERDNPTPHSPHPETLDDVADDVLLSDNDIQQLLRLPDNIIPVPVIPLDDLADDVLTDDAEMQELLRLSDPEYTHIRVR